MKSQKFVFSAGKYWIGDPCYAVKNWELFGEKTGWFGSEKGNPLTETFDGGCYYNNQFCFVFSTAYGDGVFFDNYNNEYGVDAGLLGILPIDACDDDSLDLGHEFEFENDFTVYRDNEGTFYFENVIIPTGDEEEIDYYEDYDEDYDPYNSDEEDDEEWYNS